MKHFLLLLPLALLFLSTAVLAQQSECVPWPGPESGCCEELVTDSGCFTVCGCEEPALQPDPCIRSPEACADDPCEQNPLLCAPECRVNEDCGGVTCTEVASVCLADGVRSTLACSEPVCQDSRCRVMQRFKEETVSCNKQAVCDDWSYFCDGNAVKRKRSCTVEECSEQGGSAACAESAHPEEEGLKECALGCQSGQCIGAVTPPANASAGPRAGLVPLISQFRALQPRPGVTYSWDFGDGSPVAVGETLFHRFDVPGTYSVTLTATSEDGASATDTVTVTGLAEESVVSLESLEATDFYEPGDQVTIEVRCSPAKAAEKVRLEFRNEDGMPVAHLPDTQFTCNSKPQTFGPGRGGLAATRSLYTATAELPFDSGCSRCTARATFSLVEPAPEAAPIDEVAILVVGIIVLILAVVAWRM